MVTPAPAPTATTPPVSEADADTAARKRATFDKIAKACLLSLPSVFLASIGLLVGACSVWMLVDYEATTVFNDSSEMRVFCQDATSLKPEMIWINPGERKLAHDGSSCPVFGPSGAYLACISDDAIRQADGGTVLVSIAAESVPAHACPNSSYNAGRFNPATHRPDTDPPSDFERRGSGFSVLGLIVAIGALGAAVVVGQERFSRGRTVDHD
jgi:hypothetical protein